MTMEDTKVDVTPSKRSKKLRSTSEASNDSKSEKDVKIVQNGTASSSEISEVESDKDIPKSPKTKKIVKKAKVEQQKEVKNSIKEENNPDSSPSEEDFLGFDDNAPTSNKKDEQRKNFLSFVEELQSTVDTGVSDTEESGVEDGTDREDKEEEEMTVDTAAASDDTDSDQMEIDSKAGEKVKESDVDIMETESNKSGESKVSKKSENEKTDTADKGNTKIEYCGACSAEVDDAEEGICCDGVCERWFHLRCSGLSQLEYNELSMDENAKWACPKCSGKPTPNLSAESKTPKISVRKDLQDTSTPRLASKRKSIVKEGPSKTPKIDISNPAFLKPFDFGWKRELVYRTTDNTAGKRQGDIYYYTPKGKKLRSLREISEHVVGTELTIDNFTFWKEPIGIDDPEKEIIRDAKIKLSNKDGTASPSLPKKVVTPKVTKAAKTTPKLTATVTPIDSTTGAPITPKASASVTPRVVLKGKTSVAASPKVKIVPTKTATPKVAISKDKKKKSSSDDEMEIGMLPPLWEPTPKSKDKLDVCSIRCLPAMGLIPTLQCVVCLCLYHPECVGLQEASYRPIHSYKCKNCQLEKSKPATAAAVTNGSKAALPPPPLTPISSLNVVSSGPKVLTGPPKLQKLNDVNKPTVAKPRPVISKNTTSIVGGVTTWLPPSSTVHLRPPAPTTQKLSPSQKPVTPASTSLSDPTPSQPVQTLINIGGKRYIVVPKHNVVSVCPSTTGSTQMSESSSAQTTMAPSDPDSTLTPTLAQSFSPGGTINTSSTLIVGSPPKNAFQKPTGPPGMLLVPYINSQQSPAPVEGQQPQYVIVNNSSVIPSGNFLFGNIPQPQQLILPTVPTSQPSEPNPESAGVKRAVEGSEESPVAKRLKSEVPPSPVMNNFMQNVVYMHSALMHAFQYLKVQELLRASRVCHLWHDIAFHKNLWETVRMKNSQVKDWEGFATTLQRAGTKHLDLRKILISGKDDALKAMWTECVQALSKVKTLVKIDFCRCTSSLVEQIAVACPQLENISAVTIKNNEIDFTSIVTCKNLTELKIKSQSGIEIKNVEGLGNLNQLRHLSLTTVKNLNVVLEKVGQLTQLESLELGELTNITKETICEALAPLTKLKRLRLEKGQQECPTDAILKTISELPALHQLELINFDIKLGFDDALALCSNIKTLLIIPTYVTQSATTNHLVIEGVGRLSKTLTHFVWGLTLELLRVTDLFIDQWEQTKQVGAKSPPVPPTDKSNKKSSGDSIPILKPVKDGKSPKEGVAVTQVDVLQLPKLHKVLTTVLPNTKIIILKVPFSATWRQTIGPNVTQ